MGVTVESKTWNKDVFVLFVQMRTIFNMWYDDNKYRGFSRKKIDEKFDSMYSDMFRGMLPILDELNLIEEAKKSVGLGHMESGISYRSDQGEGK